MLVPHNRVQLNKVVLKFQLITIFYTDQVIGRERDDIESREKLRNDMDKTTNHDDTMLLVAAVTHGKSLRPSGQQTGSIIQSPQLSGGGTLRPGPSTQPQPGPKAPSAIKTNIKAGNQVHPYNRN